MDDWIEIIPDFETYKTDMLNVVARIDSIVLCMSDGEIHNYLNEHQMKPSSLIEVVIDNAVAYANICNVYQNEINPFIGVPTERYFFYEHFEPPFQEFGVQLRTYATYFNCLSQAYEPFIEPWDLDLATCQKTHDSALKTKMVSNHLLQINFTTGMIQCLHNIWTRLRKSLVKMEK